MTNMWKKHSSKQYVYTFFSLNETFAVGTVIDTRCDIRRRNKWYETSASQVYIVRLTNVFVDFEEIL